MKIVIDIPEHIYEHAVWCSEDSNDEWFVMRAIAKCTPLPKGHEYIDRNNAITSICQWFTTAERCRQFSFTTNLVKQIVSDILCDEPTVICADKGGEE